MLHNNDWEIFIFCQIIIVIIVIIVIIMLGPHFALFTTTTVTDSMSRKQTSVIRESNTRAYAFKAIATRQHFSLILFVSRCGEVSEEETDDGDDETLNNKHCQWDF